MLPDRPDELELDLLARPAAFVLDVDHSAGRHGDPLAGYMATNCFAGKSFSMSRRRFFRPCGMDENLPSRSEQQLTTMDRFAAGLFARTTADSGLTRFTPGSSIL
jgi:hypothetical protein